MAGTQVVDQIQLGNNGTAANNFVIKTMNDGTMKIQRGNIGGSLTDVLTIDVNGVVTPVKWSLGQTWQNLTASRALNTDYTNTTGKPIKINVTLGNGTSTANTANLLINGTVTLAGSSFSTSGTVVTFISAEIPPGDTYRVTGTAGTPSLYNWSELR